MFKYLREIVENQRINIYPNDKNGKFAIKFALPNGRFDFSTRLETKSSKDEV